MRTFAMRNEGLLGRPLAAPLLSRLQVSKPNDPSEREADRIADRVMRMAESQPLGEGRSAAYVGQAPNAHSPMQAKWAGAGSSEYVNAPRIVGDVLQSPGESLDQGARAFMEPRFGHDFSQIRVHADERAAASARALNARAFASGAHLVFGAGQYAPATDAGRRVLAHELTHSIQQGFCASGYAQSIGGSGLAVQRQAIDMPPTQEETSTSFRMGAEPAYGLRNKLLGLLERKDATYTDYRDAIAKASYAEQQFVLQRKDLLAAMLDALGLTSFARCVERLGRRAPTYDELRSHPVVSEAIQAAWLASDIGKKDRVAEAHEEGGWVFMNLIDGSLTIQRAKPEGTDYIKLEPAPDAGYGEVLVAMFHTHPTIGRRGTASPSGDDLREDKRRGVPNLVAGNVGTKPGVFQVRLSGAAQRKHLASDTKIPGPSGGIAP